MLLAIASIAIISKPNDKVKKESKDSRCVDKICISNVFIEETLGSKSIRLVLKNEGEKIINKSCVRLVDKEKNYVICLNDVKKDEELEMFLEYTEKSGNTIDDYSLEKASKQETEDAN